MSEANEPNYGAQTICRPLAANVPDPPPGWGASRCPYCGAACWVLPLEPRPLPPGCAAACTSCALKRGTNQREMDRLRFERERAARPSVTPAGNGDPK
jgi:hypothetical protein